MIVLPPRDGSSNDLADWLELEVFLSQTDSAPTASINQCLEIDEDDEPERIDVEDELKEKRSQQLVSAIEERRFALKQAYPFALDSSGMQLRLTAPISTGGYAYLFCLIVSSGAPGGLLSSEGSWVPDLKAARGLFQICATVASAGFIQGPAFSVGWPRPDSSRFLDKLKSVYARFGDGRVHDTPPPGAPPQVKDDDIDVIAWQHANDVLPRTGYFLGQAATGNDWPDKGLRGLERIYHGTWFVQEPASQVRLGSIMPFCLESEADGHPDDHESQQEIIKGKLRRHSLTHGDLLHRYRVPWFLEKGRELHAEGVGPIEQIDDLPKIVAFVDAYRAQLRTAAAVA